MNTLLDPVIFGFFGGSAVGKTTLLARLSNVGFNHSYVATDGINDLLFHVPLKDSLNVPVKVIEFGSGLLPATENAFSAFEKNLSSIVSLLDCAFFVIDVTDKQSVLQCNQWIEAILRCRKHSPRQLLTYILAHKADLPFQERIISPKNLDRWTINTESLDWSYTVGHPELGDVDYERGNAIKQRSIEDITIQIISVILQQRDSKYFKLLSPGSSSLSLRFVIWKSYAKDEIDPNIVLSTSTSEK
jgi:GTPase SAR1 family protein